MMDNIVYHYTSISALRCILDGIEHKEEPGAVRDEIGYYFLKLHASNPIFLNDPTENKLYVEALLETFKTFKSSSLLKSMIERSNSLISTPYALAFSELGDDLNMWRSYADNAQGVALGFKLDEDIIKSIKNANSTFDDIQFLECEYQPKEELIKIIKKQEYYADIKKDLEDTTEDSDCRLGNILQVARNYGFKYKDIAYKSEKEWRLVIFAPFDSKFKDRKNEIVNYKEVTIPLSALKQIVFAPRAYFDKLHYSVCKMIRKKVCGSITRIDIDISKSKIPYSG
jgi:hypothetical protein